MAWLSFTEQPVTFTIVIGVLIEVLVILQAAFKQIYQHPLSKFPGPKLGFLTSYRKAFVELVLGKSWHVELQDLHKKYGPIVRVGPNDLHFSEPQAYHDIYNNSNRWDKDETLYHSFGSERSSFGYLTYKEAKERKDVLNKSFSASVVQSYSPLVQEKVDSLCEVFTTLAKTDKLVDLTLAFRCMTIDIITYLSFGNSIDAIHSKDFQAPIIEAMEASLPTFVAFKHFHWFKNLILNCPPDMSKKFSPATSGLVDLQLIIRKQIKELVADPSELQNLPHNNTIYHALMDPSATKNGEPLSGDILYEESQNLMFAGSDTVGITLSVLFYYMLQTPGSLQKVQDEVKSIWPSLKSPVPSIKELEKLPYFNACLKEGLRFSLGVISGLPRIVPEGGAVIVGEQIPEDTIVETSAIFVHFNEELFPDAHTFKPERFIDDPSLDNWMVSFSRGPRSCLGINLAWAELRLTLASVVRRFDLKLDPSSPAKLEFRDCFLPKFYGSHIKASLTPATS